MALTVEQISDVVAPAFKTAPERAVFIELAQESLSASWWGVKYNHAVALLAAHMMALSDVNGVRANGEAGAVTSKSEGSLSVSFGGAGSSVKDSDLAQTHYGMQLISLRKSRGPFIGVTGQAGTTPAVVLQEE